MGRGSSTVGGLAPEGGGGNCFDGAIQEVGAGGDRRRKFRRAGCSGGWGRSCPQWMRVEGRKRQSEGGRPVWCWWKGRRKGRLPRSRVTVRQASARRCPRWATTSGSGHAERAQPLGRRLVGMKYVDVN